MKPDTFERLFVKCQEKSFLSSEDAGNAIPFYIVPYQPREESSVMQEVSMLINRLNEVNINILKLDLFTLCIELLNEQDIFDDVIALEKEEDPVYFLDAFDSALNDNLLADNICQQIQDTNPSIVFIQGIGKIYPFKRLNPLMNKMHDKTEGKPIVFFYPGIYDGNSFKLFGLQDGNDGKLFKSNYYQAYNLE